DAAVYFIDLDGMHGTKPRRRQTSVFGYHREQVVERARLEIPVSPHPVDSVNLKDPRTGLYEQINELVHHHGVERGRAELERPPGERQAGLTVNEYETLLMKHDLAEVLRNPFRFMAETGRNMLRDPRAIPNRTIEYAKFDMVRVMNQVLDKLGMNESLIEKMM